MNMSDYLRAVRAATGKPHQLPLAAYSVLKARLGFGIGPLRHSMYGLFNKPGASWAEYIDENQANKMLISLSSRDQHLALRDKLAFTVRCQQNGLPVAPVLFRYDRATQSDADDLIPNIRTAEQLRAALQQAPDTLFVKLIDGSHGDGAFRASRIDHEHWRFGTRQGKAGDLFHHLEATLDSKGRGWLFQPLVQPHQQLGEIMAPGALGTLRILSYLDQMDRVHLALPTLRIPAGKSLVDNFSLGASGNLIAAVDLDSGRLAPAAYSLTPEWPQIRRTDVHPDTGGRISGFTLPFWAETCDLVKHAQAAIGEPSTIGWDIAITESGPLIIEANSAYGTAIHEVALDRGIGADFETIVNAVRTRRAREQAGASTH